MSVQQPNSFRTGPDERGHFGLYGGRFVAETLMPLILDLEKAYAAAKADQQATGLTKTKSQLAAATQRVLASVDAEAAETAKLNALLAEAVDLQLGVPGAGVR